MAASNIHFMANLAILFLTSLQFAAALNDFPIAKPNCTDHCGNVRIPFPFGTTDDCYLNSSFLVTCNQSYNPPKPFLTTVRNEIEITEITLDGQLTIWQYISHQCYYQNMSRDSSNDPGLDFPYAITINSTGNKFTIVGCDTIGFVSGRREEEGAYRTGCFAICYEKEDLIEGSCTGIGCCQTSIPKNIWRAGLRLRSLKKYKDVWDFNKCGYAFIVKENAYNFSAADLTNLKNVKLPMVADWAVGYRTCEEDKMNGSTYACKSDNSNCYKPHTGYGYRCSCLKGFEGNPYISDGCKDIDECQENLDNCSKNENCVNTVGNFTCECPKGYHRRNGQEACCRSQSLVLKFVAGAVACVIFLILAIRWLYLELKRRRLKKMRQKFFLRNGGVQLQEELARRGISSSDSLKLFTETELEKATNKFHSSMIIGQGGFGTVYKGTLPDNRVVAIKKSKQVDPKQVEQFINEVIIFSQINHRNVVKFLGCCMETLVPLLVYDFVPNGTLYEHTHNKAKSCFLTWDMRLRIATEAAGVLSYLHSEAFTPIIHRDVKSANILLDCNFTAKVSDFGASKLVSPDPTRLSTVLQGTLGYIDPEYLHTAQLTEKSDVYSFGVVLAELLTGLKALSYDRAETEQNLAYFFLSVMKKDRLIQILDDSIVYEENADQVMKVAFLAKSCLHVKGDDRPCMRTVAIELEGLRLDGKHTWDQTRNINVEEHESLLGVRDEVVPDEGNSSSFGFDSGQGTVMHEEK